VAAATGRRLPKHTSCYKRRYEVLGRLAAEAAFIHRRYSNSCVIDKKYNVRLGHKNLPHIFDYNSRISRSIVTLLYPYKHERILYTIIHNLLTTNSHALLHHRDIHHDYTHHQFQNSLQTYYNKEIKILFCVQLIVDFLIVYNKITFVKHCSLDGSMSNSDYFNSATSPEGLIT